MPATGDAPVAGRAFSGVLQMVLMTGAVVLVKKSVKVPYQ
ncbi:hypothetical protein D7Y27_30755 [Corallococcus sp. AB004]|nr:hypothetical protein D7Y04_15210 [Corallococcus sp. AB038B]RKI35688.1 hypothetical protein D7Y27_30755 [Corallococcus sp. AB004]